MKTLVELSIIFMGFVAILALVHVENIWSGVWARRLGWVSTLGTYASGAALAGYLTYWFYYRQSTGGLVGTVILGIVCVAALVRLVYWVVSLTRDLNDHGSTRRVNRP